MIFTFSFVFTWKLYCSRNDGKKRLILTFRIQHFRTTKTKHVRHAIAMNSSANFTNCKLHNFYLENSFWKFFTCSFWCNLKLTKDRTEKCEHTMIWWRTSCVPFKCIPEFNWGMVCFIRKMLLIVEFLLVIFEIHFEIVPTKKKQQ